MAESLLEAVKKWQGELSPSELRDHYQAGADAADRIFQELAADRAASEKKAAR